ncbi:MAG: hypothetical protein PUJ31_04285, partial [Prevotella pectinovora]|nr:hypothetical protein [Prevotella pectinovora]
HQKKQSDTLSSILHDNHQAANIVFITASCISGSDAYHWGMYCSFCEVTKNILSMSIKPDNCKAFVTFF